jgi:death on curing protein
MPQRIYLTVAEVVAMQAQLIEEFGGRRGIRDSRLLESAVMRPRNGYYAGIIEEAAALLESLLNNHPFHDGNKRISFAATDVFLRANGYVLDLDGLAAHKLITGAMERHEFSLAQILDWLISVTKVA